MGLPRTFVSFSGSDIGSYGLMLAWKANTNIDFNFADVQLDRANNSDDEDYIKRRCRERINMAGKFIQLIGQDTRYKYKYVRWEAEVALEKDCTIIGVNLDQARRMVEATCPPIIRDVGAIFVPFSPAIVGYAINNYVMNESGAYYYDNSVYKSLGYNV